MSRAVEPSIKHQRWREASARISAKANRIKTDVTPEEVRKVADWMDKIAGS